MMTNQTSNAQTSPRTGPLGGVRILDMATVLAAPMAATLCADLGAEVVKLELPDGSDALRSLEPVKGSLPLHWKVTNRGKRGISLDVRKPEGRELFLKLLPGFDALVENFRVGTLDRWGLDIDTLHKVNPHLVVLRLTGFGQTGPYASRPGFARIFEAMSGIAYLTGEADGPPQHMNLPLGDAVVGVFGAFAIASAMVERRAHPEAPGREIDLSATEAMLRLLETLPVEYEQLASVRERAGSRATYTAPSNMYRTADGAWVTVVGSSAPIFRRMCDAMGRSELADDPRFANNQLRLQHVEDLDLVIGNWCKSLGFKELAQRLDSFGVPFSKVNSIEDVLEEPHFKARKAIVRMADPELGEIPGPCTVPRFSGYKPHIPRSGPSVGEHNADIFGKFGLNAVQMEQLRVAGVI